jgi:hypothetical protein
LSCWNGTGVTDVQWTLKSVRQSAILEKLSDVR